MCFNYVAQIEVFKFNQENSIKSIKLKIKMPKMATYCWWYNLICISIVITQSVLSKPNKNCNNACFVKPIVETSKSF